MSETPERRAAPERVVADETGAQRALGYVHHIFPDRTETHLTLDDRHTNRHGTLHGGLATMMLDSACGFAASRHFSEDTGQLVVTLSFTTNYLAASSGPHVVATGRVTGGGRSVAYCEGRLTDDDGLLIATATGVFKRLSRR